MGKMAEAGQTVESCARNPALHGQGLGWRDHRIGVTDDQGERTLPLNQARKFRLQGLEIPMRHHGQRSRDMAWTAHQPGLAAAALFLIHNLRFPPPSAC